MKMLQEIRSFVSASDAPFHTQLILSMCLLCQAFFTIVEISRPYIGLGDSEPSWSSQHDRLAPEFKVGSH